MIKDNFSRQIVAVLPEYNDNGDNMCRLIFTDGGSEYIYIPIADFIREWLRRYRLTLSGQMTWASSITSRRTLNPIVIHKDIVLIPLKVRRSYGANDGSHGYILLPYIDTFDNSKIILHNKIEVSHISSAATISNKILHAKLLRHEHIDDINNRYNDYNN